MRRSTRTVARLAILAAVMSLLGACAVYEPAPGPGYYSYYGGPGYYYGPTYYGHVYVR
jgi:hypothetical protein